jgi:hypothetical protein
MEADVRDLVFLSAGGLILFVQILSREGLSTLHLPLSVSHWVFMKNQFFIYCSLELVLQPPSAGTRAQEANRIASGGLTVQYSLFLPGLILIVKVWLWEGFSLLHLPVPVGHRDSHMGDSHWEIQHAISYLSNSVFQNFL